jgi:hypothetical protein
MRSQKFAIENFWDYANKFKGIKREFISSKKANLDNTKTAQKPPRLKKKIHLSFIEQEILR